MVQKHSFAIARNLMHKWHMRQGYLSNQGPWEGPKWMVDVDFYVFEVVSLLMQTHMSPSGLASTGIAPRTANDRLLGPLFFDSDGSMSSFPK